MISNTALTETFPTDENTLHIVKLFVPGRVCIFGEHSDWAGGYRKFNRDILPGACIVSGTNQGIYADCAKHPDKLIVRSVDNNGKALVDSRTGSTTFECPMDVEELRRVAQTGGPFSYIAGVAMEVLLIHNVGGLIIQVTKMTLPIKKGLSSSAAICVLTARAFNELYGLHLKIRGEMDLAYKGEIQTPSKCGRMDQCCAFGRIPVIMKMDGDRLDSEQIKVAAPLYFVIVDLHAGKNTLTILQDLNGCYPIAKTEIHKGVQKLLGPINQRIIRLAMQAISQGDPQEVGRLMIEAQSEFAKYAQPACPSELTSPVLYKTLNDTRFKPHIWGCKGVGSQGDGSAQFLCKTKEDQDEVCRIIEEELKMTALRLTLGEKRKANL